MTQAKKPIDWTGVRRDYEKTELSVREIARCFECSEKAIRLKARAEGWERPQGAPKSARPPAEEETAQPLADAVAPIVERARPTALPEDIDPVMLVRQGRELVHRMFDELDATTSRVGEMEEDFEAAAPGASNARRRAAMRNAVSLATRSGIVKNLALAAKTLAEAGAPAGKKQQKADAAAKLAGGVSRFAAPAPPKLVVSNP